MIEISTEQNILLLKSFTVNDDMRKKCGYLLCIIIQETLIGPFLIASSKEYLHFKICLKWPGR